MKYPWQIIYIYYYRWDRDITADPRLLDPPHYMCRLPGFWFPYIYTPGTFSTKSSITNYWLDAPWCRT